MGRPSEPGHGTTFEIYLPRAEGPIEPETTHDTPGGPDYGLETILLVEDNEGVRHVVQDLLRTKGYEVLEAASDEEALKLAERHRGAIDLLLADVVLPGRTARELADRLARWHPRMRVLYMSGHPDGTLAHYGVTPEKVAFIRKPFTLYALARKVREVLDESEEERS